MDNYNGVILINKPKGWTSQDVASKIKRVLHVNRIGHAGTLDPMATGVLVVLVGSATKLSDYLMSDEKEYECEILIGKATDTEDCSGTLIAEQHVDMIENIDDVLNGMIGSLEQTPPMYSSVRFQGRKLYEIAREGLVVEREKRTIEVKTLERTSDLVYEDGCCKFKFKTSVSKGTYIRTLCVEIGNRLGYPALMNNLNRTKSGSFHLENCVSIDDVLNNNYHLYSNYEIIKMKQLNIIEIRGRLLEKVLHGMKIRLDCQDEAVFLVSDNNLIAIYEKENDFYKAKRVWN